ncbi:MAG: SET domain-containing protein [Anaerolineales bacterium]|nr:SET domain-containing protein [Anaerolineales bacterium]
MSRSYVSPKLEARPLPEKGGHGLFARAPIAQGERLLVWSGDVVTGAELAQVPAHLRPYSVQIEEDLYLAAAPDDEPEPADYVNHSCSPNAGFDGQIVLVAIRPIAPDDEICIDYAMCDGTPYDEFDCQCGAATCRGRVTGDDWRRPELQARYAGYFVPYLQRRIAALHA